MKRETDDERWGRLRERRRWRRADTEWALAAWEASGESLDGFTRKHGIQPRRLAKGRTRLKAVALQRAPSSPTGAMAPVTLLPVTVAPTPAEPAETNGSGYVVVSTGGVRVEIRDPRATAVEWVASLVGKLGRV